MSPDHTKTEFYFVKLLQSFSKIFLVNVYNLETCVTQLSQKCNKPLRGLGSEARIGKLVFGDSDDTLFVGPLSKTDSSAISFTSIQVFCKVEFRTQFGMFHKLIFIKKLMN